MNKNRFAGAAAFDSDDEVPVAVQKQTKTQKKKEERKVSDKPIKINVSKMAEGGFDVVTKDKKEEGRPTTAGRPKRGNPNGPKPQQGGRRQAANNEAAGVDAKPRRERKPFQGKAREDAHPYDRRSGTGRGRRPTEKKDGHGKGNWGDKPDGEYKKKGAATEEAKPEAVEEVKEEAKEEAKVEVIEEIIGYSLDEVRAQKATVARKQARASEQIKDKITGDQFTKTEKASTLRENQYKMQVHAKTGNAEAALLGFGGSTEERQGSRPTRGRGGAQGPRQGGRKNARQALKLTDQDFPALE